MLLWVGLVTPIIAMAPGWFLLSIQVYVQNLGDNLFYGIESKADTLLNRSLPYCDVAVEPYQYDLEKAKKILEEAGWRDRDGDGIRGKDGQKLAGLVDKQEIQQQYGFILNEIHQNVSYVPISYIKELMVFNVDKIADYRFNGQPAQFDAAGIRLK